MKNSGTTTSLTISETQKMAQSIAKMLVERAILGKPGEGAVVLALCGDLGSGKTTFMQFFGEALGIKEKMLSPTFVIEKIYKIGGSEIAPEITSHFDHLVHIDAYRLDDPREMLTLGWEDIIKNPRNIIAVEWADKIAEILPENHIRLDFEHHDEKSRLISLKSQEK